MLWGKFAAIFSIRRITCDRCIHLLSCIRRIKSTSWHIRTFLWIVRNTANFSCDTVFWAFIYLLVGIAIRTSTNVFLSLPAYIRVCYRCWLFCEGRLMSYTLLLESTGARASIRDATMKRKKKRLVEVARILEVRREMGRYNPQSIIYPVSTTDARKVRRKAEWFAQVVDAFGVLVVPAAYVDHFRGQYSTVKEFLLVALSFRKFIERTSEAPPIEPLLLYCTAPFL